MNKTNQETISGSSLAATDRSRPPATDLREGVVYPRRRRLLTGGAAGAGIFLAMQARTALGGTICQSPSAMLSGNQSNHPHDNTNCSGGRSPGFWKQPQHFGSWVGLTPPTFNVLPKMDCKGTNVKFSPCGLKSRGTPLSSIFPGAPANVGVWEVLVWPTNYPNYTGTLLASDCANAGGSQDIFGGKGQLLRTLVAAYLNRGIQPTQYPIRTDQIVAMWEAVKNGGVYYPNGGTSGAGLTADGVRAYIEGMYHIGALNDVEGCDQVV